MGANAQTSVPTFTAGEVLTAANMNISARTGIPVFATSVTRDAAFGGTGEKTLAEGQFAYLEDSNTTQYYDGSAWQPVGASSGLSFITGATFTTATSFSLPTNTFSATYLNYRLIVNLTALTADADFTLRVRASGTDNTTSNYYQGTTGLTSTNAASNVVDSSATSWNVGESDAVAANGPTYNLVLDIFQPNIAIRKSCVGQTVLLNKAASAFIGRSLGLVCDIGTAVDSLTFISSVASSITGSYKVYGYANS